MSQDFIFKKKDTYDTNLSIVCPCFPLKESDLYILLNNSSWVKNVAQLLFSISLASLIDIIAKYGMFFFSKVGTLVDVSDWPNISLDLWIFGISSVLCIVFYVLHSYFISTPQKKLVKFIKEFYKMKEQ